MLLASTYFGPVQWYSKIYQCAGGKVDIEAQETFPKQTYRNRCVIASPNGPQTLSIPVEGSSSHHQCIKDMMISPHGRWQHIHWQALLTAYGDSPFFEYYQDDIRPFFIDEAIVSDSGKEPMTPPVRLRYLLDYNLKTAEVLCDLLGIPFEPRLTEQYVPGVQEVQGVLPFGQAAKPEQMVPDYRDAIRPKHAPEDPEFTQRPYHQVYQQRYGFLPNLSILDLLFNMGPEAVGVVYKSSQSSSTSENIIKHNIGCVKKDVLQMFSDVLALASGKAERSEATF